MSDRLKKLEALIGVWSTTITMINEDGTAGNTSKATDTYRWSPSKNFVLHDADVQMTGEHTHSLEIIALDPNSNGYNARAYEADGTFADYKAALDGRSWTIDGDTLRFRGSFSEDGNVLSGQWDESRDGSWKGIMRISLQKQP